MDDIKIIDNTHEAQNKYGHCYESDTVILSEEHIKALQNGKQIAFNDGEYSTFLTMDKDFN